VWFVGTAVILEMQPDRSMVAQRGASSFSVYADLSSAPPATHLEQLRATLVVSLNTAASMVRGHGSLQESGGGFMGFAINGDRDLSARIGELVTDLHERPGDGATLDAWEDYAKAQREKVCERDALRACSGELAARR
jgi:hypothetical protein